MKNKSRITNKPGFSIAEVLISMLVFSVGMVSVANLMLGSLKSSVDSRNQIIAAQLAQEGAELIRNYRDNNLAFGMAGGAFAGITADGTTNICPKIDGAVKTPGFAAACVSVGGFPAGQLFYSSARGYRYDRTAANEPGSPFLRKITIGAANPHVVRSMVIWGGASFPATAAECTLVKKCTYVDLALNEQGWK